MARSATQKGTDGSRPAAEPRRSAASPVSAAVSCSLCVLLLVAGASYWTPWIDHSTAALTLSGQDMGEFVKFVPAIKREHARFPRQVFYLPPFTCTTCLVLMAANRRLAYPRWLRAGMLIAALFLLPGLLPPAWGHPKELLTGEFRLQGIALALGLALIAAHGLFSAVPLPSLAISLGTLSLVALIPVQWAFWTVQPMIWAAYGTPTIRLGWGLWIGILAWAGAFALSGLVLWQAGQDART